MLRLNWGRGHQNAREELFPLVYGELRRIARHYLRRERPDHAFLSGDPVHQLYLCRLHKEPPNGKAGLISSLSAHRHT